MVDKPNDKVEIFIDDAFKWCEEKKNDILKATSPQREKVNNFRGRHPRIAIATLLAICIIAVSLVVVGFATPKTVTVIVDDSIEAKTTTYETTSIRVDSFIDSHEIDYVYGQDIMDAELYDIIKDEMVINIKKAAQIPAHLVGFMPVIEKNIALATDPARMLSWRYLKYHSEICRYYGEVLLAGAKGNMDEARRRYFELEAYLSEHELEFHRGFDVFLYVRAMRLKLGLPFVPYYD